MIPKTKLHKEIVALSKGLPEITHEQTWWAFDKCLGRYAVQSRKTMYCLDCGYAWKDDILLDASSIECECPGCLANLKIKTHNAPRWDETEYFAVCTVAGGYQVVRMICVKKFMKKKIAADYFADEVMQHWIAPDGKITSLQKHVNAFGYYCDMWVFGSELEIRTNTECAEARNRITPYKVYPKKQILPVLKRNGFKGGFHTYSPRRMFKLLLSDSYYETLLKSGQFSLLKAYNDNSDSIVKHWASIKICIRNGYNVKDATIWLDYLDLLEYFNKDLHSVKYVCPAEYMKAHDKMVKKKNTIEKKRQLQEQMERAIQDQAEYIEMKNKFFGLEFVNGDVSVKVIESVQDFVEEGRYHNHCVYVSQYYKKADSLIFSAKVDGIPVETVEVSISKLKILQCRGRGNKATAHHDKILELVNKNLYKIKSRMKRHAKESA